MAFVKSVSGVTPGTAEIAAGEADEHTRPTGEGRFALDAVEDFVDNERVSHERQANKCTGGLQIRQKELQVKFGFV